MMTHIPIAIQLYTVRDDAERDLAGTLSDLAQIGYSNVELAGMYGQSPTHIKNILENTGLKPVAAHVGLESLDAKSVGKTISDYLELGVYNFVIPYVSEELRQNGAGYAALAERLNSVGELLSHYGSKLSYHNHDFEFREQTHGIFGIEALIANTDPALVSFELDTYWSLFAGHDPVDFINRHARRINLLHIKDLNPEDRSFAPVGTGLLPLDGIVAAAIEADVSYLIVEQDTAKGSVIDAVTTSFNNLKKKGYA